MKQYQNIAFIAALTCVIAKMIYFLFLPPNEAWDNYVRLFYLLAFLIALFFGLRSFKIRATRSDFTHDVKTGMKITSIFALIISIFTWIYYTWINPEYFANRISDALSQAPEESIEAIETNASFIFNAFTHSTITLLSMMVIGFFYTLIMVLIMRAKPEIFVGSSQ
tara:strand:- start:1131 stop:1628 length:498 start_codon:yes stop_codon:yes gene_type:complete